MANTPKEAPTFDFEVHKRNAVEQYGRKRDLYEDFAKAVRDVLADAIRVRGLRINDIQYRAKGLESFGKKVTTPTEQNPQEPKYKNPVGDVTDLSGVRVITFFPRTVDQVCQCIQDEFEVIERVDHTATAQREERLGYQSVHYLVRLGRNRRELSEYRRFDSLIAEVQVRTIMQHAWAEIEHDIRYKSASAIPMAISRRFMTLAGLLEIADREFEAIQEEDASLRDTARTMVEEGRYNAVEITPDVLRAYLARRLGPDDRISDYTYDFTAKALKKLGFRNLAQIDECISGLDDDRLSRFAVGSRSGQVTRFEVLLVASMGENYLKFHPYSEYEWFQKYANEWLEKLKANGVAVGSYLPNTV